MQDVGGREIEIVGAGLVGSLLAIFLERRGARVTVFERRTDPRLATGPGGRSINLVVASRGLRALRAVGLEEQVLKLTAPVAGRMMHDLDGELAYQPYGRNDSERNYSVPRGGLNRFLIEEAARRGVRFRFGLRLDELDLDNGCMRFHDEVAGRDVDVESSLVIGADGAGSAVRAGLARREGFEESTEFLGYGYKELTIPPTDGGEARIDPDSLHIWPRGRLMLMALRNLDNSFTVTLYLPESGEEGFEAIDTPERLDRLFATQFGDAVELLPDLHVEFASNPTGRLGTVRCRPWFHRDRVLLVGDAAHAIVPFFGQGMNCGFEDCRVLDELLDGMDERGVEPVFREFDRLRKPDADAIADMALDNFVEMRDRVGDAAFLLRKGVEHRLEEQLPREYRSRYSMVMYGSEIPYHVAAGAGEIQRAMLDELCRDIEGVDELDLERARRLVDERLAPYLERNRVSLDY